MVAENTTASARFFVSSGNQERLSVKVMVGAGQQKLRCALRENLLRRYPQQNLLVTERLHRIESRSAPRGPISG